MLRSGTVGSMLQRPGMAVPLKRFASGPDANRSRFIVWGQLLADSGPAASRLTWLQAATGGSQ